MASVRRASPSKARTLGFANLLEIHDADVATVFAIEAIGLVDHFMYLNRLAREQSGGKKNKVAQMPTSKQAAAGAG